VHASLVRADHNWWCLAVTNDVRQFRVEALTTLPEPIPITSMLR